EIMDRPERALFRLCRQFLAARPLFRMVRLLAEGRTDTADRRASGVLFAARLGRGPHRLYSRRLAQDRALAAARRDAASALSVRRRQARGGGVGRRPANLPV